MKAIYKFHADCGRMGDLEGVFVRRKEDIKSVIGQTIYFGEVLGKHSDVYFPMEESHFTEVTTDENFIKLFEDYNLSTGINPFDYDEDFDDEEDEDEELD